MRVLGLICARGGSKGIPRKNIKILQGKPLIAYSIDAALKSQKIDRIIVSTDDIEIAEIAKECGAEIPFMRPAELASDKTIQIDAIKHAVKTLQDQGDVYDVVALLQPTCPMRNHDDIDGALSLLEEKNADTVITVTEVSGYHPFTMYKEGQDQSIYPLLEVSERGVLRQEFPTVLWRNGAVYAMKTSVLLEKNSLYGDLICGYRMPENRSANIDEPLDWYMTEALMKYHEGE